MCVTSTSCNYQSSQHPTPCSPTANRVDWVGRGFTPLTPTKSKGTSIAPLSEQENAARIVNTNAVILRGLLGMMEKQHLVTVQHGSNSGWRLARTPEEITLLDVYRAVKPDTLFALHHTQPNQQCVIGCGIRSTLGQVYANVQDVLEQELARTTIADILRDTIISTAAQQQANVT